MLTRSAPSVTLTPRQNLYASRFGFELPASARTLGATTIANDADFDDSRVGFHAAFMQALERTERDPLEAAAIEIPTNARTLDMQWIGDLPGFEEWLGDRKLAGLEGFSLRSQAKDWSSGIRIKADDFDDDNLGLVPAAVAGLAGAARQHLPDLIVKLLLNGFDGAAFPDVSNGLAYDGAFFFSDSHRGGMDNLLTVAFDAAGLDAAEQLFRGMTTYDGQRYLRTRGSHILVGPKLEKAALKLLSQEYLASGESNTDRNRYELIVSPLIRGDFDDWWFLLDLKKPIKPTFVQMRERISTSAVAGPNSQPRFIRNELWYGAQARYNVGSFEWRLAVGSKVA